MWFSKEQDDLAIAFIPKAGVNSLRVWLCAYEVWDNDDPLLQKISRRWAFVRCPIDRLASAYSYFKEKTEHGTLHSVKAPVDTWENFVDYALVNDDVHWRPQYLHIGGMQTEVFRFEDINQVCGSITKENTSRRVSVDTAYRIQDLHRMYEEDFMLRAKHSLVARDRSSRLI